MAQTQEQTAKTSKIPVRLGLIVICAGGFMDAYSYLLHDHVFANGQTGNVALLGIRLASGDLPGAARYLAPIVSFVLGIMLSKHVLARVHGGDRNRMMCSVAVFEACAFALVALLPEWTPGLLVTSAISFCAAMSYENFRKFGTRSAYSSVFCSGNLRSLGETLYEGLVCGDSHELHRAARYAGLVVSFCVGAALCCLLIGVVGKYASLAMSALFLLSTRFVTPSEG